MSVSSLCPMLMVFDMKTSLLFYCEILGFHIHQQAGPVADVGWVWLKWDNINLMLNTLHEMPDRPPHPDPLRIANHSDTCLYFGCEDADEIYETLRSKGIDLQPPQLTPYGMKQLYLKDPDGYSLCFQQEIVRGE